VSASRQNSSRLEGANMRPAFRPWTEEIEKNRRKFRACRYRAAKKQVRFFEFELFMEISSHTKTKVLSLFPFKVFDSTHFFCLEDVFFLLVWFLSFSNF